MTCVPDAIGANLFLRLEGTLESVQPTYERVDRPGIDGMAYRALGNKAKEFQLTSLVDVDTMANAALIEAGYLGATGGVTSVVKGGVTYGNMLVLNVGGFEKTYTAIAAGGLSSGSGVANGVLLKAVWTLVNLH